MDPTTIFCPNMACPARGQVGQGNIGVHSRQDQRFICTQCRKSFAATKGTAFYRMRTPAETVVLVLTLLAHGCPLQAIVVAFGFDERTVAAWWVCAGTQAKPSRSIWSSIPVISGTSKPMRSASRPRAASCGWRWR
jgi:transposase-like protein